MDADIARWVLDFLVRQPIHDSTLTSLLSTLPISDTDSNLKKLLLLRKIQSEISSPTHNLLSLLEHIEELDHMENVQTIESIKRAYCAVALHSTLKFLDKDEVECFDKAVKNIWTLRVGCMEKYGVVGLLSDELISWKEDLEAALSDFNVRKRLLEKWKCGVGVVEAVRGFVEEAMEMIGPSFLQVAASTLDDGTLNHLFGMEETQQGESTDFRQVLVASETPLADLAVEKPREENEASNGNKDYDTKLKPLLVPVEIPPDSNDADFRSEDQEFVSSDKFDILEKTNLDGNLLTTAEHGSEEDMLSPVWPCHILDIQKGTVHRRSKVRAAKQHKRLTPRTSRGVKIVDDDELSDASPRNNYGCLSTPEVAKLQENLRSSTLELQEMVKDPLPEAVEIAKNVASKMDYVDKRTDVIPAENSNLGNEGSTHQTNATKTSLMERNKTARTYEWDESSDGPADPGSRLHLFNPKKGLVTLKKNENPKPLRRKRKFWSNLEEDTLRAGVQKYGMGNWKLILNMYGDVFDERTEVDLKDKWRNMNT